MCKNKYFVTVVIIFHARSHKVTRTHINGAHPRNMEPIIDTLLDNLCVETATRTRTRTTTFKLCAKYLNFHHLHIIGMKE